MEQCWEKSCLQDQHILFLQISSRFPQARLTAACWFGDVGLGLGALVALLNSDQFPKLERGFGQVPMSARMMLTLSLLCTPSGRCGFGIVSLTCHLPPLSYSCALDQAMSRPLAAAWQWAESLKWQALSEAAGCLAGYVIPALGTRTRQCKANCCRLNIWSGCVGSWQCSWLGQPGKEEGNGQLSLSIALYDARGPLKDFNMVLERKSWRRLRHKKLDGGWRVQRAWELWEGISGQLWSEDEFGSRLFHSSSEQGSGTSYELGGDGVLLWPLHDHSSHVILCMSCAARGQLAEAGNVLPRRTQPK